MLRSRMSLKSQFHNQGQGLAARPCLSRMRIGSALRKQCLKLSKPRTFVTMEASTAFGGIPISILSDSYKATHFLQYPNARKMVAYGEFRCGYNKDMTDTRMVSYGIRYVIEHYINKQWTLEDVEKADIFYKTHMAPLYTTFPFPRSLFEKFVIENDGYFPVKIEALPEGTAIHARVPMYQITAEAEYSCLCTFLESLLTMMWYPSTVATLSRRARDVVESSFERTSDKGRSSPLVESRLQDFGFRGCTCVEQSIVGGAAHLLSFVSSDTMSAAYYVQFELNHGKPVAQSIPATEHSVMTAWPTEQAAIENMVNHFGTGTYACVMDSYDYGKALNEVIPSVAAKKAAKGGYMVLRPDSGDPVEAVLMALTAADRTFGSTVNSKGYKVIRGCGVIQGDGISVDTIRKIAVAIEEAGYAADNMCYGMGGGLLQKVNRDTMSFATKLSHIVYSDGREEDVMKQPATDAGKFSLPGVLAVKRVDGIPTAFPADSGEVAPHENMLQVVYDHGPVEGFVWDDFSTCRERLASEWAALPPIADNISPSLKRKIFRQLEMRGKKLMWVPGQPPAGVEHAEIVAPGQKEEVMEACMSYA